MRQYILEFLSPISLPHGTHLLGAIAVAWNDRRIKNAAKNMKRVKDLAMIISVFMLTEKCFYTPDSISLPHGTHLLGAIAVAWNDKRNKDAAKNIKRVNDLVMPPTLKKLMGHIAFGACVS